MQLIIAPSSLHNPPTNANKPLVPYGKLSQDVRSGNLKAVSIVVALFGSTVILNNSFNAKNHLPIDRQHRLEVKGNLYNKHYST